MDLDVSLIVHDMSLGALARAHALALVLGVLGHRVRTFAPVGAQVWRPLQGTGFAGRCAVLPELELTRAVATGTDLLVAVKPLPGSLGLASRIARRLDLPLLADVDDPDIEVRTTWQEPRQVVGLLTHNPRRLAELMELGRLARRTPGTVSNPVLQRLYGGELVPHARADRGVGAPHTRRAPVLGFIGTVRDHKGIGQLRAAVAALQGSGWRLVVTGEPPPDARPWESWVGDHVPDSYALLQSVDVVVVASTAVGYGRAQLPMKLVDAMLAGRAVVVSDTGPLPWAVGPRGVVVPSGNAPALVAALRRLEDPAVRQAAGDEARAVALARYTPRAVAPAVQRAVALALAGGVRAGAHRSSVLPPRRRTALRLLTA